MASSSTPRRSARCGFIDPMPEGSEEAGGAVDVHDDGVEYETVHVATAFPADAWVDGELQLSPGWFWSVCPADGLTCEWHSEQEQGKVEVDNIRL